jgi:carbon storage regulator
MLCTRRQVDDVILIGDNIRIVIMEIRCGVVKLGIEAPREIDIMREESIGLGRSKEPACPKPRYLRSA